MVIREDIKRGMQVRMQNCTTATIYQAALTRTDDIDEFVLAFDQAAVFLPGVMTKEEIVGFLNGNGFEIVR